MQLPMTFGLALMLLLIWVRQLLEQQGLMSAVTEMATATIAVVFPVRVVAVKS
jgi:hypothetical protein